MEEAVWAVASTVFCGKLGPASSEALCRLTTELAMASVGGGPASAAPSSGAAGGTGVAQPCGRPRALLRETLRALSRHPPVVAAAGAALSASRVLPGVLLSEPVRLWAAGPSSAPAAVRERVGPVLVMLLGANPESAELSGVEGPAGASVSAAVEVRSEGEYAAALRWRQQAACEAAAVLAARGVGLLVSSEHVSELFASAAAREGVAVVQLLPTAELRRVASALGVAVCPSGLPSALLTADMATIDGGYREVSLGSSRGLLLVTSAASFLLLRAPSNAIAQLHRRRVERALRAVASAAAAPPHAEDESRDGLWLCPGDGAIDLRIAEALGIGPGAGPGARVLAAAALAVPTWLCRNGPGDSRAQRRVLLRARLAHSGAAQGSPWAGIEWARSQGEAGPPDEIVSKGAAASAAPQEVSAVEPPAAVAARLCAAADAVIQMLRLGGEGGGGSGTEASILVAGQRNKKSSGGGGDAGSGGRGRGFV